MFKKILSLRVKLLITVAGVVLLFLSISTYFSVKQTGEIIQGQIESYGRSMSRALADFCIEDLLSWNYPALQLYVDYIGEQDSQIRGIKIYHNDSIIADYCIGGDGQSCSSDLAGVFEAPVRVKIDGQEQVLGKVEVYLSKEKYEEFLDSQMKLLWILSIVLLVSDTFFSYWTVKLLVLNPLREITTGTKIIGDGNLDYKIIVNNRDEIGELAGTINDMSEKLKISHQKMAKQTTNLKRVQNRLVKTLEETEGAKLKIEEEQNKTSAMISNLVDPVIVIDNQKRIMLANPAAKNILGIKKTDIGKKLQPAKDGNCVPQKLCLCDFRNIIKVPYVSKVQKINSQKYPVIEEIIIGRDKDSDKKLTDNGNKVFKVLTSEVKDSEGNSFGYMKIFYDLTKEKIVDEMKSEFISIAAHQLRTPSAGVKWALEMILDGEMGKISREAKEYIKKAHEANEQMVELVKDLLNVSYIETGKFAYKFQDLDLKKMLEEIIKGSTITAKQNNIQVIFDQPEDEVPVIKADIEKIKLAFQNLINNAIKYSKPGGEVKVSLNYDAKDPGSIYIVIKDSGIGISAKDQQQLFSKFYRGENAKKLQTEGSGLGLFIAKNVFEAHRGKIKCESEIGKGSTFFVKLPAR